MEEKILFEEKTHKFVSEIQFILILFFICGITLCTTWFYNDLHSLDWMYEHKHDEYCAQTFDDVILFEEEDYLAVKDKYSSFHEFVEVEYAKLPDKDYHDDYIDCDILKFGSVDAAINDFYDVYGTPLEDYISDCIVVVVISIIPLILVIFLKTKRSKFFVTENNIYGKKGYKKFKISFKDIIDIEQKGKKIIIKTADKKLKLLSPKYSIEIYNIIKPLVPEKTITQQITSTVDDIKLF